MLDSEEVGVLGKEVAASLAEQLSSDPVVKGLRTFVQCHASLESTQVRLLSPLLFSRISCSFHVLVGQSAGCQSWSLWHWHIILAVGARSVSSGCPDLSSPSPPHHLFQLTDECLVRYYLSRKENYDKTKKGLGRFLRWRLEEKIDQVSASVLAANPDALTAVVGAGACTKNRPLVWVYACKHNKDNQSDAQMKIFLACKIEQALKRGETLREEAAGRQAEAALEETLSGNSEAAAQQAAIAAGQAARLTSEGGGAVLSRYQNVDTLTLIFDLRDFGRC